MKTNYYGSIANPTVDIAINKSRLKLYNKNGQTPTYYLKKGQEFQIELFNPTSDTILVKIHLNDKSISQGGLVLRPGERVFLDRYFDVAKKFMFDTYEVSNSNAVKRAIQDNGDVRVEFFRESKPFYPPFNPVVYGYSSGTVTIGNNCSDGAVYSSNCCNTASFNPDNCSHTLTSSVGELNLCASASLSEPNLKKEFKSRSKTIETGRVEEGGYSNQKFQSVNKDFDYYPFHTVEYKLLPLSQKVNTVNDMKVKLYCTNCGTKVKAEHKFCANCGTKQ